MSAKLLEQTLRFLEETFQGEVGVADQGLAIAVHVLIFLLFAVPAASVVWEWLSKRFGGGGRQAVLVCGECRHEVEERSVRCPSCEAVFPSSFLRALLTLGVLWLAWWTASWQGRQPAVFWGLIAVYGVVILGFAAHQMSQRARELKPLKLARGAVQRSLDAVVRGREMWARGEAVLRILIVLGFYGSLLMGLHHYGVPASDVAAGLDDVFAKLTFLSLLLAFTSLAVLISQLRRFQGFSTLVLAASSFLFFAGGAAASHALADLTAWDQEVSEETLAVVAEPAGSGQVRLRMRDASGAWVESLATLEDASRLRFRCSLLVVDRFSYRRYYLSEVLTKEAGGGSLTAPGQRAAELEWWEPLWDPSLLWLELYARAQAPEPADWLRSLEVAVDPQEPRVWSAPMPASGALKVYIDGVRILVDDGTGPRELEAF